MQKSFSIVMDEESEHYGDEQVLKKYGTLLAERKNNMQNSHEKVSKMTFPRQSLSDEMDMEEAATSGNQIAKIPSAGPSGRQTVLRSRRSQKNHLSSESDIDDSDGDEDKNKNSVPDEYDPKQYENLDVSEEIKEVFQYIIKYIPQSMNLDNRFKPFVPEFLPAVGDIDAFLKVIPPSVTVSGENFKENQELGLVVLDEPAANQSDSALLHLQLRAESVNTTHDSDVVVKKLDNVEKNVKIIDKWIKDISALHKSKSHPVVRYTEPMPDLDELMQEWPEEMENHLKQNNFPEPKGTLDEYIDEVCGILQIPTKNKIQSLHLLFSLYAAVKSSQLFKNSQFEKADIQEELSSNVTDQLLLE